MWSAVSLHYEAYKGAQIIEAYTEPTASDKQITIRFYMGGNFETYERSLENGVWEVTEHVEGTYHYNTGTGVLIMDNKAGGAHTTATILILSDQKLRFSQSASPALNNTEADNEMCTLDFTRVP